MASLSKSDPPKTKVRFEEEEINIMNVTIYVYLLIIKMNNTQLLGTSLDFTRVLAQNKIDTTQSILGQKRERNEQDRGKVTFEREINGMYKCPCCFLLYQTKAALEAHWFDTCERVSVRERLGYTIGSSVDSELDSDSDSELDSETDSKIGGLTRTSTELTSPEDDEYQDIKCESCNQYFACFQQLDTHHFDFHTSFVQTPLMTSAGASLVTVLRNQESKFKCPICFMSFASATAIRYHLMDICMTTQKDKQCSKCLDSFADTEKLKDHINAFHQSEIELEYHSNSMSESSSSSLAASPSSTSSTTIKLERDSRRKFKCPHCSCRFSSTVAIRHHTNTFCQWKELHIGDYNNRSQKRARTSI
ncbi:hypothetical protein K501DRAFT_336008 [Backusella circina FSU 941]|nr:hypothetical protein K501DRAFT_336008 [Backusella circina FSU 941]